MSFVINKDTFQPAYERVLLDENGDPVDLSAATSVTLTMKRVGETTLKINHPAQLVDAPSGRVRYTWAAGDTNEPGDYEAVWIVDGMPFPNGGYERVTVFSDDEVDEDTLVFCDVDSARAIMHTDFDADELSLAQLVISMRSGVPTADTAYYDSLDDQDKTGLAQATAIQAKWMRGQYDFWERMNLVNESADSENRTYALNGLLMAPLAEWALSNTRFGTAGFNTIDTPRAGFELARELIPYSRFETPDLGWRVW